jgi:hypothetical protein
MSQNLRREYKKCVNKGFELNRIKDDSLLTLGDIRHLPEPVQKYLKYVGVIGKKKVNNVKVSADCKMKMGSGWVKGGFEQYNLYGSHPTRFFYMKLKMLGFIPIVALHSYNEEKASMLVKVLGMVPVVDVKGKEMRIGDTTTILNDMCIFAPAALIDRRIQWELINDTTVKAVFQTDYCTVSALLFFNEQGELVNFTTHDRYDVNGNGSAKKLKWSTPLKEYKEINGLKLASHVEAVWDYPEGPYCYIKMTNIRSIKYNCSKPT